MKNKLLVICGPTATGKTSLALRLAKKFNAEVISADSRQVYKQMDIGTGKDLPPDSKFVIVGNGLGYHEVNGVRIWGYDLVSPKKEFSVSSYLKFAVRVLSDIKKRNKLPIIVGGTGFYIKAIVDDIPTINVPKNPKLREKLAEKSVEFLYESLSQVDPLRAASLNFSDKNNPRRLTRAIEISQYSIDHHSPINRLIGETDFDTLFVGLTAPKNILDLAISKRVDLRIKNGFEGEVKNLLKSGVTWSDQSMMSLGYRQWREYMEGTVKKEVALSEWKKEERKYAKRQIVWFKKDKRINWFNFSETDYQKKVEKMIKRWYSSNKYQ
jgi:tRNA dimethylallyltransferase